MVNRTKCGNSRPCSGLSKGQLGKFDSQFSHTICQVKGWDITVKGSMVVIGEDEDDHDHDHGGDDGGMIRDMGGVCVIILESNTPIALFYYSGI